jgi:hypothetical protein
VYATGNSVSTPSDGTGSGACRRSFRFEAAEGFHHNRHMVENQMRCIPHVVKQKILVYNFYQYAPFFFMVLT